jgi:hypothetical protein
MIALMSTTALLAAAPAAADYVDDFQLTDQFGKAQDLYYFEDAAAVVILSTVVGDEASAANAVALQALADSYAEQGVEFFMINSENADDRDEIAAQAEALGLTVPVLKDELQLIGGSLGVERAGEVFVVNPADGWEIAYHGPMGDTLTAALDAVVAGEAVETPMVEVTEGAWIEFPSREGDHSNISYAEEIAPILMENCVSCHQPGSIGPWHMISYENVRGFAPMMREVLRTRRMPPYHADPQVGRDLAHNRFMDAADVTTLVNWIEAGAPRGEGEDPLLTQVTEAPEWPLGEPDLILEIPGYDVPATGVVDYQYPYVEWPLEEGRWLKATTIRAGSRETVHHVLSGHISGIPDAGEEHIGRWEANMGGYAVGAESLIAPEDWGVYVPAGGSIGYQMHYTPVGREVTDVTTVGYYFYDEGEEPTYILHDSVIADFSIMLPPNTARHEEVAYMEFPEDALLYGAFPHAHYRGQSSTLTLIHPDGTEEMVLSLPKYDFNWQRLYEFAEPVLVEAGSKLVARYEYDNSARNEANPDPDATITWGDQSFEEMLYTAIRYRWVDETIDNRVDYDERMNQTRIIGILDDDLDGLIQQAELRPIDRGLEAISANFAAFDQDGDGALNPAEFGGAQQYLREQARQQQEAAAENTDSASE